MKGAMNLQSNPLESDLKDRPATSSCLTSLLLAFVVAWGVVVSVIAFVVGWSVEQLLFEGSLPVYDSRWLVVLFAGLGVIFPAAVLTFFTRWPTYRAFYQAMTAAGLFVILFAPTRLLRIDDFQTVMILQTVCMLIFLLALKVLQKTGLGSNRSPGGSPRGGAVGLWLGLTLGFVFLKLGALGSVLDTLLAFVTALVFAACVMAVTGIASMSLPEDYEQNGHAIRPVLRLGLLDGVILLVMSVGLAQNGNQILLGVVLPAMGFGLPFLADRYRIEGRKSGLFAGAVWVGLFTFWSLAAFDPDELMSIVGMSWQEPIGLAAITAVVSLGLVLIQSVLLILFRRRMPSKKFHPAGTVFLNGLTLLLLAAVYGFSGQPGFYGERLFVILKGQTDFSDLSQISDPIERRIAVYDRLTSNAIERQKDIRAQLDRFRVDYQPYYLVNSMEVNGGLIVRWWLKRHPDVDRVLVNPILRPLPAPIQKSLGSQPKPTSAGWNLSMIGADRVWNELGVSGEGIVVGQSDSGAQVDHPEFADRYRGRTMGDDYNWLDPWYGTKTPADIGGHGTHTLGSILGKSVGVAPGAEWMACANLARNLGNPAYYLTCMQFMLAPYPQQGDPFEDSKPELGANVLNNSWGCPDVEGCDPETFSEAVAAMRAAGVFVVVSAGNSGYESCGSVSAPPAIYEQVYTVGAINSNGMLSAFSSMGPVEVDGSMRTKPDIIAPGEEVLSAYPGGTYEYASGTSMAGPHVVGVVALMWSANPALIGDIERTIKILNETARPYNHNVPECAISNPKNAVGAGQVDAYAAVKAALLYGEVKK